MQALLSGAKLDWVFVFLIEMELSQQHHHQPVLLGEVLRLLAPKPDGVYLDATVGTGGHAEAIARRLECEPGLGRKGGLLIGLDWDEEALEVARARLAPLGERVKLVKANFRELERVLAELGISKVDGVLFDLGVSSLQLDRPERGFSFRFDGPLDMRMDRQNPDAKTAAELVNTAPFEELCRILREYGEERWAARIAAAIVQTRRQGPIRTTRQLAELVDRAIPASARRRMRIHPATRTFQALRIAVNGELENLRAGLEAAFRRLHRGGVLVVISFHSLEDRIVKHFFREKAGKRPRPLGLPPLGAKLQAQVEAELLVKLVRPSSEEVARNPRARSAKLRALRKVI